MNNSEDKTVALVPASSSALAHAGPAALAKRGLHDVLAKQQADAWLKMGQELWDQRSYAEAVDCFNRGSNMIPIMWL
jgi:NADP-dependent 3-hydroxy acid dehydrogenase YdfG